MKKTACGNRRPKHTWVHLCTTATVVSWVLLSRVK